MRTHNLTNEDVRSQVRYVATHRRPGDVVLVTMPAIYGFAYYSRGLPLEFPATSRVATGFTVRLPRAANMILVGGREPSDVASGIRRAAALACRAPNPRIWIIRTRIKASEARAFADHLRGTPVEILRVGPDPLLRQTPSCPSTALA